MEQINQNVENHDNTPVLSPDVQETVITKRVTRVKLDDYAFQQAGLNKGEPIALENQLSWIIEGHLVDIGYNETDTNIKKQKLESVISEKEKEFNQHKTDQQKIKEVAIVEREKDKKEKEQEINDVKISVAEKRMKSDFSSVRHILYTGLCCIIGLYLVFFYASSINAAFFRNMESMLSGGTRSDIDLLMDSIFDPVGIFQGGAKLLFIYLGSFVFFGLGVIPHSIMASNTSYKTIKVISFLLVTLVIESLIAYKIDKSLHFVQTQISVDSSEWNWYTSPNFYLVLAFGFGAYLLWGALLELAIHEWNKRDVDAKASLIIKKLKEDIKVLVAEINRLQEEIIKFEGEMNRLKQEIENLKKQMNHTIMNPDELKRNLESYFSGWLRFLSGASASDELKQKCQEIFKTSKNSVDAKFAPVLN
ncbi:MAG: hypothetical protein ACK55K_06655 [Bacteroidota bacterium]